MPSSLVIAAKTFLESPQITQLDQQTTHLGFNPGTLSVEEMIERFQQLIKT